MSAPTTQRLLAIVLLLALAGAIGLAAVQYSRLGEARRRIERLEGRVDDLLAEREDGGAPDGIAERLDGLAKADEALSGRVDALLLRATSNSKRLDMIAAGDLEDLGLEDFVERKVDETLDKGRPLTDNRPDIDRVAEFLGLSDRQRMRVADIIDRSKDDVYELMQKAGSDGRSLSDHVTTVLNAPVAPDKKMKAMSQQFFQHGPPGSEDSYFTHVMEIRAEALDDFQGTLTEDQQTRWKGMGIDLFSVQTGHTPFKQAAQDMMKDGD